MPPGQHSNTWSLDLFARHGITGTVDAGKDFVLVLPPSSSAVWRAMRRAKTVEF